jgi:molybdopterin-guanine dinucleotide biosynthesis protein A
MTAAVVLAGGRSRRFGTDKLAAPLADGRSVLAHAVAVAAAVADELVVVVAPGTDRPAGLPGRTRIVHDPEPDVGPLLGLAGGLQAVADGIVLLVGGDMPALDPSVLRLLIGAIGADPVAEVARLEVDGTSAPSGAARAAGASDLSVLPCVIRREAALQACQEAMATGDRRLRGCLDRLVTTAVPAGEWRALDPTGRTLVDIDRPADLAALERLDAPG